MKNLLYALEIVFILVLAHHKANAQWSWDTISFEIPTTNIVMDSPGNTVWQIGEPHKSFFNTAHSGFNAILTDTANAYPPGDTSSFIYIIRNPFTQTCLTCMEFWHQYDMDSVGDKGIIDASYDGGKSWVVVSDTNFVENGTGFMWYQDFHSNTGEYTNHPLITTGRSDGWIKSNFCWRWFLAVSGDTIIIEPDSLLVRFTFISDTIQENKDGWMIDDIVCSAIDINFCTGTKEVYPGHVTVYPNPFSTQAMVQTDDHFKNATLVVYNSLGQPVKQIKNISGQSITLPRDNMPSGFYFLQLAEGYGILKTIKIVITDN